HYLFFTIIGMITSYMDFLTYPIASLGIILLLVLIKEKLPFQEAIKRILVCGICWAFGYGIMWASKWMLAAVITGKDVIKNALDQAVYRTSDYTWDPNKKITRISAIREALGAYETGSVIKIIAFNFVIAISIFIYNCLGTKKDSFNALLKRSLNYLPILGLSFIPFVWYLVLANHSLIHTFFSFRTALVLWFAINAYIFAVFVKREEK
nr:hypothetical protein [Bacilli bacterium]